MRLKKIRLNKSKIVIFVIFTFSLILNVFPAVSEQSFFLEFDDYPLPNETKLFGEDVPLDDSFVWERLDREFTIIVWDRPQIFMWLKRSGRYFPYIEKRLKEEGLPDDLKYVAVAESSFHNHIKSRSGAVGMWQFMKYTAQKKGLRKNRGIDERRNFEKATNAAINYFKELHDKFGVWNLAVAAYNCGHGRLEKAMKEQSVTDFYRLKLPKETERYLFRILAIKLIMEDPKAYGYNLSPERYYKPYEYDTVQLNVKFPIHITEVLKKMGVNYKLFKDINPHLTGSLFPTGKYDVNIPKGEKSNEIVAAITDITENTLKHLKYNPDKYYKVQPGDTLIGISIKTGVSVKNLRRLNHLNGSFIKVGQKLLLKP